MTASQLELLPVPPPAPALTGRQQLALQHITASQPIASEDLGAYLHGERHARTGRGHPADRTCDYCRTEGAQMGAALRAKGLVRQRRGEGWALTDYKPDRSTGGYDPATADIPF